MIYDTFPINDELSLLEARLRYQYFVDFFVLVESTKTFTGKPKPLHYSNNRERFKEWHHKIIHVVLDEPADCDPWKVEARHRDILVERLPNLTESDIVTLLDVDEFLTDDIISRFIASNEKIIIPDMACTIYYANCFAGTSWRNARILKGDQIYLHSPTEIRQKQWHHQVLLNGGWHFAYMILNDPSRLIRKLDSFSHTECNTEENRKRIIDCIESRQWYMDPKEVYPLLSCDDPALPYWIAQNKIWFEKEGWLK